jgi:hypothetical protein
MSSSDSSPWKSISPCLCMKRGSGFAMMCGRTMCLAFELHSGRCLWSGQDAFGAAVSLRRRVCRRQGSICDLVMTAENWADRTGWCP